MVDKPLSDFETKRAVQGAISYHGLLSGSDGWLFLHEYHPDNEFIISFHGPSDLCQKLSFILQCTATE